MINVQHLRGTFAENAMYIGKEGELVVVTSPAWQLYVHDEITPGGHLIGGAGSGGADSSTSGIVAAGSNQATATVLTTTSNFVATAINGSHGVLISSSLMIPGTLVYVANENVSNTLLVYPDTGITINALAANAPINVGPDTTGVFSVKSATELRTVP